MKPNLTIGMAHHTDYYGLWGTLQSLCWHQDAATMENVEFVIAENSVPVSTKEGGHREAARGLVQNFFKKEHGVHGAHFIEMPPHSGTTQTRQAIFDNATSDNILVMDCHVFIKAGAIAKLIRQFTNDKQKAIYSGPMHYDNRTGFETHFEDQWRGGMWGTWATAWVCDKCGKHLSLTKENEKAVPITLEMNHKRIDGRCEGCSRKMPNEVVWHGHEHHFKKAGFLPAGENDTDQPFETPGMGLGLFACRKADWPGFVTGAAGFGAEELCIHEAMRNEVGGKSICLPWLRWLHRFGRPDGVPYTLLNQSKVRNYCLWFQRLGRDFEPIRKHMVEEAVLISPEDWERCAQNPISFLDGIPGRHGEQCSTCGDPATNGQPGRPQPPEECSLDEGFEFLKQTPRDLNEHLDTIASYARKVEHATAITKRRETAVGLLAGRTKEIVVYDKETDELYNRIHEWAGSEPAIESLAVTRIDDFNIPRIEPTDLLFIDSIHSASQLTGELQRYSANVSRFIIVRGTGNFGEISEDRNEAGLLSAMRDFMTSKPEWSVIEHRLNQYGMSVLSRLVEDKPRLPSKLKMAKNFAGALAEHVYTGAETASKETMEFRLKFCSMCPHRNDTNCSVCGCPVDKKASWAEQTCPIGSWPDVDPWATKEEEVVEA